MRYHTIKSQFFPLPSFVVNCQIVFCLKMLDGATFVQFDCRNGYFGIQSAILLDMLQNS